MQGGHRQPKVVKGGAFRGRSKNAEGKNVGWKETKPKQFLELRKDDKSNSLSQVTKDSLVVSKKSVAKYVPDPEAEFCDPYNKKTIKGDKSTTLRTNSSNGNMWVNESKIRDKSKTVRSGGRGSYDRHEWDSVDEMHWRKLTPLECERLQTVPDNYTNHVSNTQRYKMLGNGWTIEVIAHILRNME